MPDPAILGLDASYDVLTPAAAAQMVASGVQYWSQCLWTGEEQPPPRVTNLRVAQQAGLGLMGYTSITRSQPGAWHVQMARSGVPADLWAALVKTPIDVELDGLNQGMVYSALAAMAAMGKPEDVYSNYRTWVTVLGNPTRPAGVGLWDASWGAARFYHLPYGGWLAEDVWGWQYASSVTVAGTLVDLNVFRDLAPPPPPPPPAQFVPYTGPQLWVRA